MAQETYLKGIERRVWMLYFEDGLLDISLGLLLLGIAISAWLPDFGVSASLQVPVLIGLEFVAVLVLIGGKRLITIPRMGHVRYGRGRKIRKMKAVVSIAIVTLVLLILLVIGPTVGTLLSWPSMGKLVRHIVIGAAMTAVITSMAYFLDFARGYIHSRCVVWHSFLHVFLPRHTDHDGCCRSGHSAHRTGRVDSLPARAPYGVDGDAWKRGLGKQANDLVLS